MLVDLTAVDWPKREKRFDLVLILYSFAKNERLRLKTHIGESEPVASVKASGPPPTGWSAKCMTCSASSLTGIQT